MILQTFDNGWGDTVPLKALEREILNGFLCRYINNDLRSVIVNSTWYTRDFHQHVMEQINLLDPDMIFVVSFFDCAIVLEDQYPGRRTQGIGYYPGDGEIDFWAIASQRYMSLHNVVNDIDLPFMCLNRKPHWHRRKLYQQMLDFDLLDRGLVSMGSNNGQPQRLLPNDQGASDMAPNAGAEQHGIKNDIFSLGHPDNWNRCLLNIVTETVYDISHNHFVSEKIYKPILGQRPFLVYDPGGARHWLESRGFQTYLNDWLDISDLDLGEPANIAPFLACLSNQPRSYFQKKIIDLAPKIQYNKHWFDVYCSRQQDLIKKGLPCPI